MERPEAVRRTCRDPNRGPSRFRAGGVAIRAPRRERRSVPLLAAALGAAVLALGSSMAASVQERKATGQDILEVVRFPEARIPFLEWKDRNGWRELRGSAASFVIENGALLMQSADSSTTVGTQFESKVDPQEYPVLEFSIRVDDVPSGANVTVRERDDAAFRMFVAFDKGGFLSITPPHTIGYVWDSTLKTGETGRAATFGQVRYIAIGSGTDQLGTWRVIRRDVEQDYRLLFGHGRVPAIEGIALKCDSNHTGASGRSAVGFIRFLARSGR